MESDKGICHIPVTAWLGVAVYNNYVYIGLGKQRVGKGHTYQSTANN